MAKYRKVSPSIWNDERFNAFSDNGKLAFLFLLTHPHMTAVGAMRGGFAGLAEELDWSSDKFTKAIQPALDEGMVKYDRNARMIWLPKFTKHNPPESPNVVTGWKKALELIPECNLKTQLLYHLKDLLEGFGKGFREAFMEDFPHIYAKSMPYQEQEQEQDQEPEQEEDTAPAGAGSTDFGPQDLVDLFHQLIPTAPRVLQISERRPKIKKALKKKPDPEWWAMYFKRVAESNFLTGKNDNQWSATIDWLLKGSNALKVLEGNYDNKRVRAKSGGAEAALQMALNEDDE